jgi:hypothetical protein
VAGMIYGFDIFDVASSNNFLLIPALKSVLEEK